MYLESSLVSIKVVYPQDQISDALGVGTSRLEQPIHSWCSSTQRYIIQCRFVTASNKRYTL
jgi:hypothetical protein